jgi:uncharacterized protein
MEPTRLRDLDVLRGFALLGILIVNIQFIASPHHFWDVPDPTVEHAADHAALWLVLVLFESKFYLLFAFLFGYSFTLQITSATTTGARFTPRFLRRLLGLYLLGLIHGLLLYPGDILTLYALLGLMLLLMRRTRPGRAIAVAVLLVAAAGTLLIVVGALMKPSANPVAGPALVEVAERNLNQLRGGFPSVIAAHWEQLRYAWGYIGLLQGPSALAGFLLGYAAGSRRLLAAGDQLGTTILRRVQIIGFPIGLFAAIWYAHAATTDPNGRYQMMVFGVNLITSPLLTAAYVATLLRVLHSTRWGDRLGRLLAPVGRMSLTNYLAQSAACLLLFTGVGLGLVGRVSLAPLLAVAVALYLAQVAACRWWTRRFRYGPAEWLLRTWTLLARVPFLARPAPAGPGLNRPQPSPTGPGSPDRSPRTVRQPAGPPPE